jgi:N6-adenosine-specific RNA methylase IME4
VSGHRENKGGTGRYRTIVADPPWPGLWWAGGERKAGLSSGSRRVYDQAEAAYALMPVEAICAIGVEQIIDVDAHLYLWCPDLHLVEGNGARVARAWGFEPLRLIVWRKRNIGLGHFPRPAHEAVMVCRRGRLPFAVRDVASVQDWKQPYANGHKIHSAKPDGLLDLVERASPGPYLEMFARRARFGWDYWGDESLQTAVVA